MRRTSSKTRAEGHARFKRALGRELIRCQAIGEGIREGNPKLKNVSPARNDGTAGREGDVKIRISGAEVRDEGRTVLGAGPLKGVLDPRHRKADQRQFAPSRHRKLDHDRAVVREERSDDLKLFRACIPGARTRNRGPAGEAATGKCRQPWDAGRSHHNPPGGLGAPPLRRLSCRDC